MVDLSFGEIAFGRDARLHPAEGQIGVLEPRVAGRTGIQERLRRLRVRYELDVPRRFARVEPTGLEADARIGRGLRVSEL